MKTLYLVRHAKSSWKHPELTDFERPLNGRGKRNAPDMGQRLRNKGVLPDLMLSSPANRALTTCQVIAENIGYNPQLIKTDEAIYHAGIGKLLHVTKHVDDTVKSLMLFGHNPGFTDFANALTNDDIWNIPTCGIFACSIKIDSWIDLEFGLGKKLWYDFPKNENPL